MLKNIVYIHGANSSPQSFNYIKSQLPSHNPLDIHYTVDTPLKENISIIDKKIKKYFQNQKFSFISHSLGGLIALKLSNNINNEKTITMSSPFGGSKIIEYFRWICPRYQMFEDIKPSSKIISELKQMYFSKPIFSFVTTAGGNPLLGEPNDGTVTISSQMAINGLYYEKIPLNHFEILLSDRIINKIKKIIFEDERKE